MPPSPTLDFEKNPGFLRPGETAEQYSARNVGLGDTTISSSTLAQPTTPFNIPAASPTTGAAGLEGQLSEFAKQYQVQAQEAQKAKEQSGKDLANALFSTQGEATLTNDLYSRPGGVDETQRELQDINQQLLQEQEGFRREVETIQDNAEGLTRGAVAGRIDEARRRSLRTQADLSVIQLAKQGRFDSAKAIADRAIAVQLEKDKQRNDILKFIYEENRDAFNKSEQRAFEVAQGERERELDRKENEEKEKYELLIAAASNSANPAPASVLQQASQAGTPLEALSFLSPYLTNPLEVEAQLADIAASRASTALAYANMAKIKGETAEGEALKNGKRGEILDNYSLANEILSNPNLATATGRSSVLNPANYIPGSDVQLVKNQINQLTALLSLENREKLKGSGAVSDYESRQLAQSASALGTNLSDEDFERELKKVRGVFATSAGLETIVVITSPDGQKKVGPADRDTIESAVASGYTIEYK